MKYNVLIGTFCLMTINLLPLSLSAQGEPQSDPLTEARHSFIKNSVLIPPSPQAASLGEYGNTPMGYYTGTPNISIPLYSLSQGKLNLPIGLSYNASGHKVVQDDPWVGLG